EVIEPDGTKGSKEVIRVGAFNLVSDGKYLDYDANTQTLSVLARQPASRFVATAEELTEAEEEGYVRFDLDPSRGSILSLLVQVPRMFIRGTEQVGMVGWIIIFLGIIGLVFVFWRWMAIGAIVQKVSAQIGNSTASEDNLLGRVLSVYEKNRTEDTET